LAILNVADNVDVNVDARMKRIDADNVTINVISLIYKTTILTYSSSFINYTIIPEKMQNTSL